MSTAPSVDDYLERAIRWRAELTRLCAIVRGCGLQEAIKWGSPCFSWRGRNVVGVVAFKSYFGLWFHQGALLSDPDGRLVNAQQGRTRGQRQWRMRANQDIDADAIRAYVREAMRLVEEGRTIVPRRRPPEALPEVLQRALASDAQARAAFAELRAGQRREYAEYVAEARRETTRLRRIERILPMIRAGVGLNDRYR